MRLASLCLVAVCSIFLAACRQIPVPTYQTRAPSPVAIATANPQPRPSNTSPQPGPSDTPKPTAGFSFPNPFVPPAPTATPLPKPHVLRINIGVHPDILDPQRASTNGEVAVLQLAYEGLTRVDEKGQVLPGAAYKWEFSSDGKLLTFYLREGLVRADGTRLTAKDYEYAFKHALDPRLGAADQSFLDDVHGALAAYSLDPKSKPDDILKAINNVGIKAVDDTTLTVTLDQPAGYWPSIAATWVGWPSDRNKVEADPDAWWFKPENHNGNGPFLISDIQDQVIKFVPNPNYRGGKPKVDRIEFYWIADPAAALDAYTNGQVDVVRITSDTLAQVQADPALSKEFVRAPSAWVTYLGFNVKKAPFTDRNVRKAFSQALDRDGFVKEVLKGAGKPYLSWIPPGIPGYDEFALGPSYDPQAAVRTMVDAGLGTPDKKRVDCNKLGTVKLTYSSTPRNQILFQYLAGDLTRVFACPVLLEPIDPGTYPLLIKDARTAPQFYLLTWQEEYPHPQDWLFLEACAGVYASRTGYCNKEYDAALTAANQELDFDKSMDKYRSAQRIFVGDVAAAFLWNNENMYLIRPFVKGLWDGHGTGDSAWPGQFGPVLTYDVDTSKVSPGYPAQ